MPKLSVVMIVKNEEANLPACLAAVSWADEVVVLDTGSSDNTITVATGYGAVVQSVSWQGYGKTKQLAVAAAHHNWVFALDADEVVTPRLKQQIIDVMQNPAASGYKIKRDSFYLGKPIKHCGWNKDYTLRLFDRTKGTFNDSPIHEKVILDGPLARLSGPLWHYTYPTLHSHLVKLDEYSGLQAAKLAAQGKRATVAGAIVAGLWRAFSTYTLKLGFLDGLPGFLLCLNSGYGVYLKYLKLWEVNRSRH